MGERIEIEQTELTKLRRLVWGQGAVIVLLVMVCGILVHRTASFATIFEENLELKGRLQEIDRRMTEVDRILLRVRLYDAQLKSLGEARGEHGPIPEEQFSNHRILEEAERGFSGEEVLQSEDLRPAEAWAAGVQARADTFLSLFELAEPDLNELMGELEDLRALDEALPSTWPVNGTMTSGFGWRRHPLRRTSWKFHSGLDLSARRGTPIYAAAPGVVAMARFNSGYGNMVKVDHGFGITTVYAHCTTMLVKEGETVDEGKQIATVGSTGRVTGPHLHFEVRLDGHAVDPLDYLPR